MKCKNIYNTVGYDFTVLKMPVYFAKRAKNVCSLHNKSTEYIVHSVPTGP